MYTRTRTHTHTYTPTGDIPLLWADVALGFVVAVILCALAVGVYVCRRCYQRHWMWGSFAGLFVPAFYIIFLSAQQINTAVCVSLCVRLLFPSVSLFFAVCAVVICGGLSVCLSLCVTGEKVGGGGGVTFVADSIGGTECGPHWQACSCRHSTSSS